MDFMYNNYKFKNRRQRLRIKRTKAEIELWAKLRGRQINGMKFFRQYSVGPCVLDFYCPEARLAIELDGAHHFLDQEQALYDQERTEYLEESDIKMIRFNNDKVCDDLSGVITAIKRQSVPAMCRVPSLRVREG